MEATLLCVDDEPNILSALRRLFRPEGYKVHVANGGAEGLALLAKEPVDVVISDMRMPHMSGAVFLGQVRQGWPETVRILLTGFADVDSTVAAINDGQIARYLSKPWNDAEVLAVVRDALERKQLRAEKLRLEQLTQAQNTQLKDLNANLEQKVTARTAELHAALKGVEAAHAALHRGMLNGVRVYANFIALRSGGLAAHGKRVAERARAVAQKLGLPPAAAQDVAMAALLHDIGKLSLPDAALLAPPQSLGDAERDEYRRHPAKGAELLAVLSSTQAAAELVAAHHERFDGRGFPGGLRGSEIPLGARILAVADDHDEAVNGLLAPAAFSAESATGYLLEGRGKRYDPAVVDAHVALFGGVQAAAPARELLLRPSQLEPGMVIARDVVGAGGKLLLVSDYALDAELIDSFVNHERTSGSVLRVAVRLSAGG